MLHIQKEHKDKAVIDSGQEIITVGPQQVVVTVKGIVCSFCAVGAEKNLSKLTSLDQSKFGDNGVLIDIHSGKITLAINSISLVCPGAIITVVSGH